MDAQLSSHRDGENEFSPVALDDFSDDDVHISLDDDDDEEASRTNVMSFGHGDDDPDDDDGGIQAEDSLNFSPEHRFGLDHQPLGHSMPIMRYHDGSSVRKGYSYARVGASDGLIPSEPTVDDLSLYPISCELKCPICFELLRNAVFAVPCGHAFCHDCLTQNGVTCRVSSCPTCRRPISLQSISPAIPIRNMINSITIRCVNSMSYDTASSTYDHVKNRDTCDHVMSFYEQEYHSATCPYGLVECEYVNDGCTKIMTRIEKDSHSQSCEYRSMWCICGTRVICNYSHEHDEVCECKVIQCSNNKWGCTATQPRNKLAKHLCVCPFEAVKAVLEQKSEEISSLQFKKQQLESVNVDLKFKVAALKEELSMLRKIINGKCSGAKINDFNRGGPQDYDDEEDDDDEDGNEANDGDDRGNDGDDDCDHECDHDDIRSLDSYRSRTFHNIREFRRVNSLNDAVGSYSDGDKSSYSKRGKHY